MAACQNFTLQHLQSTYCVSCPKVVLSVYCCCCHLFIALLLTDDGCVSACTLQMKALHSTLCRAANLPEGTDLECCQEIRFKPTVMIQPINRSSVLHNNAQLEGGDLICFQRAVAPEEEARYIHPRVFGFLTYIRMSSKSAMTQSSAQPSCTTVAPTTSGPADTGECCPLYTMQQQARSHPDLVQYTQDLST